MPLAACQVILHQAFLQRPVTTHFIEKSRQAEVGGDAGCCEGIRTQQARQVGYTWFMIQERACVTDPCLPGIPQQGDMAGPSGKVGRKEL